MFLETIENSDSISETAQKLYLTQPYISHVIKKYEQIYNVILIYHDSFPIKITPAGHLLISYLRKNSRLENQLRDDFHRYEKNEFLTLRMGIAQSLGENFNLTILPKLIKRFHNLSTKTIKDNRLDLFVGNTIHLPSVYCGLIYTDTQVFVIGKNSCLYQPGKNELSVNPQDLQAINHEDFIVVDGQQSYQKTVDNYFREIGLSFILKSMFVILIRHLSLLRKD